MVAEIRFGFPDYASALWGLPGGDLWAAIGGGNIVGFRMPVLDHRVNGLWSAVTVDALPIFSELRSVWAAAPDDVWAVGTDIIHGDGIEFGLVTDAPAAVRTTPLLVTGDAHSVWLVAAGPRFFRRALGR